LSTQTATVPVLILKEGTGRSSGKEVQRSNIMAARTIAEAVRSALGPKGMDKMLVDSSGDVIITSDGRTILDKMDIEHPAAKMMIEVAKAQDAEVGDGTTSAVILAGALLEKAEELIAKGVHPTVIVEGYSMAAEKALETLGKIAISVEPEEKGFMRMVAATSVASKLVAERKEQLAEIAVEAVLSVAKKVGEDYVVDLDDVTVEKKTGESLAETKLIKGLVLDKEVVHSGMPKRVEKAKIALLESALEIKKTEFDAKINIELPEEIDSFLREEENTLRGMVEKIVAAEANVVFCQKGIDDLAQHFMSRKGILALKQVKESDMKKLAMATGGEIVTNLDNLSEGDLGFAELVEERKIGNAKMTFIEGCKNPTSVAILIRGADKRFIEEAERSVHDALCVVRDVIQELKVVAGGGAPEMELSKVLKDYAQSLPGREQLAVQSFGEAIEAVPLALSENAGLDSIDIQLELRARHEKGEKWAGVDVLGGEIRDMRELEVYEPLAVKKQTIKSATEAATMILSVDDVIASGKMKAPPRPPGGMPGGGYGGMPPEY
jgi:thermosome